MKNERNLLSGNTPMLILSLLDSGDMYGYQMIEELAQRSENAFQLKEGTLYPLLHALEKDKCVRSYTAQTPSGRERKYYHLTNEGKILLELKKKEWQMYSKNVNAVIGDVLPSGI